MKTLTEETPHFSKCGAPLCAEAKDITDESIWYSDEPICNANIGKVPVWIRQQRKIKRATQGNDVGYFNLEMLKRNCVIKKGIKRINGDKQNTNWQIKRWFEKHKPVRILSEKEKMVIKDRLTQGKLNRDSQTA